MGKLVVSEFVSVDGVFEDPGGAEDYEYGGWTFKFDRGPEGDKFKVDELMDADALLLGRVTYDGFARAWPTMEAGVFGEKMNSMPKYVVSRTLKQAEWENSTVIDGDGFADRITELKQELTGHLLVNGSGQLVRGLAELGLVDEYRLMVFPTVLGRGKRLFDGTSGQVPLRLLDTKPAGDALILTYAPR
jgi:dihydrofolate reductase